eukprot:TRINITY_DN9076_c0_g1_i2.p1 TRINITY_DN9076_c0_g1~~TRINITY_DN9076_c0_g1_i2.p1  ORF type:complete len:493 (+),score=31.94 TRINITY_DN9076_c0_g1_i2:209-1480(+)
MIDSPYMSAFGFGEWQVYLWSRVLCVPAFMVVFLGGRDILWRFVITNPIVFLDKTCIDQIDDDRKRRGILKLGAFLSKSDKMLVLYTNTYLTKLWTVYEIAAFLCLRNSSDIIVCPLSRATSFMCSLACMYIFGLLSMLLPPYGNYVRIMILVQVLGYTFTLWLWIRKRHGIIKSLATFDIRQCSCTVEEDRPVILSNIALLMVATGKSSAVLDIKQCAMEDQSNVNMTEQMIEQALDDFNLFVRQRLPEVFQVSQGSSSFNLQHYLVLAHSAFMTFYFDILPYFRTRLVGDMLWNGCGYVYGISVVGPILSFVFEWGASPRAHLEGLQGVAWFLIAASLYSITPTAILYGMWHSLKSWSLQQPLVPAVAVATVVPTFYVAVFLARRCQKAPARRGSEYRPADAKDAATSEGRTTVGRSTTVI